MSWLYNDCFRESLKSSAFAFGILELPSKSFQWTIWNIFEIIQIFHKSLIERVLIPSRNIHLIFPPHYVVVQRYIFVFLLLTASGINKIVCIISHFSSNSTFLWKHRTVSKKHKKSISSVRCRSIYSKFSFISFLPKLHSILAVAKLSYFEFRKWWSVKVTLIIWYISDNITAKLLGH